MRIFRQIVPCFTIFAAIALLAACDNPVVPPVLPDIIRIFGTDGNDSLLVSGDSARAGSENPEFIFALAGNDTIQGGGGDDQIEGGAGNDSIDGGEGSDTAIYSLSSTYSMTSNGNGSVGMQSPALGNDSLQNVERIILSVFDDVIIIGTTVDNTRMAAIPIDGNEGSDRVLLADNGVTFNASNLRNVEVYQGGSGNDTIIGGSQGEVLIGGGGNDTLRGAAGLDSASYPSSLGVNISLTTENELQVSSAAGSDSANDFGTDTLTDIERIVLSALNNTVNLNAALNSNGVIQGFVSIDGGSGYDTITLGNTGGDFFTSAQYINFESIQGGTGNDSIRLGRSAEHIHGGAGDDVAIYGFSGSSFQIGLSTDSAIVISDSTSASSSNFLHSLQEVEEVRFSAGNDTLSGYRGSASPEARINLNGGAGADTLTLADADINGNAGVRVEFSAAGAERLSNFERITGGSGADSFVLTTSALVSNRGLRIDGGMPGRGSDATLADLSASVDRIELADGVSMTGLNHTNIENIIGGAGAETLIGSLDSVAHEVLHGGAGNDILEGAAGNDLLIGGEGSDTARYSRTNSHMLEFIMGNPIRVESSLSGMAALGGTDTLEGIETIEFSAMPDSISGSPIANITLNAGAGNDSIRFNRRHEGGIYTYLLGAGADRFVLPTFSGSVSDTTTTVIINDYNPAEDIIDFTNLYNTTSITGMNNDIIIRNGELRFSIAQNSNGNSNTYNFSLLLRNADSEGNLQNQTLNYPSTSRELSAISIANVSPPPPPPDMEGADTPPPNTEVTAMDGNTLVVGLPYYSNNSVNNNGRVFVYTRDINGEWSNTPLVLQENTGTANQNFGSSVDISGDWIIVGAPGAIGGGAAFVYSRNRETGEWNTTGTALVPSNITLVNDNFFGEAVAIDGHASTNGDSNETTTVTAVVGATRPNDVNGGAAVVFTLNSETGAWTDSGALTPPSSPSINLQSAQFAAAVDIDGDAIIVGAPGIGGDAGTAYLFERSGGSWSSATTFTPPATIPALSRFGASVAIQSSTNFRERYIIIAAPSMNVNSAPTGAVYIFIGNNPHIIGNAPVGDENTGDLFGSSVAIDGGVLLVGAPGVGSNAGAVYLHTLPSSSIRGSFIEKITAGSGAQSSSFGASVALSGSYFAVGDDSRLGSGTAPNVIDTETVRSYRLPRP